jgi:hypothetical protein
MLDLAGENHLYAKQDLQLSKVSQFNTGLMVRCSRYQLVQGYPTANSIGGGVSDQAMLGFS